VLVLSGPESPPLAVESAGTDEEWRDHQAYKVFGYEAYLATRIWVNEKVWGTVGFLGRMPRSKPFTSFDKDIVRLIAQWIGGEIARQEANDALNASAAQRRRFVREMLASVTEGKLRLCDDEEDLPCPLPPALDALELTSPTLRLFRKHTEEIAQGLDLPEERIFDLVTAVGEAGMNAVKHGGGAGTGRIHSDSTTRTMQVWISDRGSGIREDDLHRATLEKGWSGAGSFGHGFYLMLQTVDRAYLLTGPQGTTVVLEQEAAAPQPAWLLAYAE
jgi:anti-sigma regulatory factor (Ser/Thr protein kinase)